MKYLIAIMFIIGLVTCLLVSCSPYRSKGKIEKPLEQSFTDYNYGEFEDVVDLNDKNDIYHVKYVHIIL